MTRDLLLIDCPSGCAASAMERLHRQSMDVFGAAMVRVDDHARAGDRGTQLYLLNFSSQEQRAAFLQGPDRAGLEAAWATLGARWMIGGFDAAQRAACAALAGAESFTVH